MISYQGKGVFESVAIGRIVLKKQENALIPRYFTENAEEELVRIETAKRQAVLQLVEIYEKALADVGEADAQIFRIHQLMLEDEEYHTAIKEIIVTQHMNAEYAVKAVSDNFSALYASMEDEYIRERAADVRDVSNRLLRCLKEGAGRKEVYSKLAIEDSVKQTEQANSYEQVYSYGENYVSGEKIILCSEDLAPSEIIALDKTRVAGIVTALGSTNSHMAILAQGMNLPAIVGVGEDFLVEIQEGDPAIIDGSTGQFYVNPEENLLANMREKEKKERDEKEYLHSLKGKENVTLDGTRVSICANLNSIEQIDSVLENDADGIGLFRSEFLYLERSDFPTEEQQFQAYKQVLERMPEKKVIIRSLDIGADKQADYFGLKKEENPAMGLRAIRICLKRPEILKTQLRALYRASVYGRLGILYPMIIAAEEVARIKEIAEQVKEELTEEHMDYSREVEMGIMIETPAAAIISDRLAPMVDFFSVGTNDLVQYTLACDRQNPDVEEFCNNHHESVLRLIELAAKNAHDNGIWIGICGELAADVALTERFLKMGIDELSVAPGMVLKVREAVRKLDLKSKGR